MSLCPICQDKTAVKDFRPFCSKRCADIDLGRWFNGGYAIPTEETVSDSTPLPDGPPQAANDQG